MEFDWSPPEPALDLCETQEVEEAFEDPFSLRLLPDSTAPGRSRYALLGRSVAGKELFCVFRTDGKMYRVIFARAMSPAEKAFYHFKNGEFLL